MRKALSRDVIIEAALELVDREGLEKLSMRNVAARLGVQAMSLYNHVANKAALLDGIHEALLLSLDVQVDGLGWEDTLRATAAAYRQLALAHPSVFVLLATRPVSTGAEASHAAPVLTQLAAAGLDPERLLLVVNTFFSALNGVLLAEVAPVPGHADVPEPDTVAVFRAGSPDASADAFADHLDRLTQEGRGETYFADRFDTIVEVLLTGLRLVVVDREG